MNSVGQIIHDPPDLHQRLATAEALHRDAIGEYAEAANGYADHAEKLLARLAAVEGAADRLLHLAYQNGKPGDWDWDGNEDARDALRAALTTRGGDEAMREMGATATRVQVLGDRIEKLEKRYERLQQRVDGLDPEFWKDEPLCAVEGCGGLAYDRCSHCPTRLCVEHFREGIVCPERARKINHFPAVGTYPAR